MHGLMVIVYFLLVTDIDWYGDSILWVDSSGLIFQANVYDPSSNSQLPVPQNAESLAVDWLGGVLYWGDLKQHKVGLSAVVHLNLHIISGSLQSIISK